jgi:hypothetical protein
MKVIKGAYWTLAEAASWVLMPDNQQAVPTAAGLLGACLVLIDHCRRTGAIYAVGRRWLRAVPSGRYTAGVDPVTWLSPIFERGQPSDTFEHIPEEEWVGLELDETSDLQVCSLRASSSGRRAWTEVLFSQADVKREFPSSTMGRRERKHTRPARTRAKKALDELYSGGIPSPAEVPNSLLCKKVGDWLKRKGLADISDATILRAAGRRVGESTESNDLFDSDTE